ncbi:hypothetical protein [Xanthomonas albilineans]|uniref:hypothetical protein n=1 Tax=Xanthomonas albilineans TaxID=29447 RepID=UPI0005F344A6|nr:hypothetical protein [Xanthomonas albilineans]
MRALSEPALLWSVEQVGWLQALGHTLYVGADAASVAVLLPVDEPPASVLSPAATHVPSRSAADALVPAVSQERRRAPTSDELPEPAPVAPTAGIARAGGLRMPDRLQIALLRASSLNPNDPATQALMATWPLDQLRGNPAAKRALWPQLRALRKRVPR